jgi:hypothetical protein
MKRCQATFCAPLKILKKWACFIRKVKFYTFIENTLKIDNNGRNFNIVEKGNNFAHGESYKNLNDTVRLLVERYPNEGFTKFKIQRVVNLFENTGSVRELNRVRTTKHITGNEEIFGTAMQAFEENSTSSV